MTAIKRIFNGHDFSFVTCVCGLTKDEYDDSGQPPCAGPPKQFRGCRPQMMNARDMSYRTFGELSQRDAVGLIGVVHDNEL
jgi:hypothetical protein